MKWERGQRGVHYINIGGKLQKRRGTIINTFPDKGVVRFLPDDEKWETPYVTAAQNIRKLVRKPKEPR